MGQLKRFLLYPHNQTSFKIVFFVYIIKSAKDGMRYIGSTKDLKRRIKEHNSGVVFSTKHRRPFKLVYFEGYADEGEARKREHNLKLRSKALAQLVRRISKSLAS